MKTFKELKETLRLPPGSQVARREVAQLRRPPKTISRGTTTPLVPMYKEPK